MPHLSSQAFTRCAFSHPLPPTPAGSSLGCASSLPNAIALRSAALQLQSAERRGSASPLSHLAPDHAAPPPPVSLNTPLSPSRRAEVRPQRRRASGAPSVR